MPRGRSGGRSHGRSHGHRSHGIGHRSHHHHHHHRYRGHYHHRPAIVVPPSTDKSIVFPYNFSTNKFNIQSFNPSLTNNKINSDEVQAFLTEIESRLVPYTQARSPRAVKFLTLLIPLLIIAIAVVIPVSIVYSQNNPIVTTSTYRSRSGYEYTYSEFTTPFPIGIPIVVGIFVVYMIFYAIMRSVYSQRAESKLKEIRPSLQQYINERGTQWNERGFMWMIPGHFPHWIELENLEALKAIGIDPLLYGNLSVAQKIQMMGNAGPGAIQISFNPNGNMNGNMVTPTPGMNPLQMFIQPQQVDQFQQNQQYSQFQQQQNQPYGQFQQQQPTQGIYMQNQFNGNTFNNNQGGFYA